MEKTKALMELEQKAEAGNKKAIEKLGEKYADLFRKFRRTGETPKWIIEGLEKVVDLYIDNGIDTDGKIAVFLLAQAYLDTGEAEKYSKMCELYISFLGLEFSEEKLTALNNLACRFAEGQGVEKDTKLSLGIFKLLTYLGDSYGRLNLAEYLAEGKEIEKDLEGAIDLYKSLVICGYSDGTKELARERLARLGYSEDDLDELENYNQLKSVAKYMKGNFVCIEVTKRIRYWSVNAEDILPIAQLQDEGLITDEIKVLFKTLQKGGTLIYGSRARENGIARKEEDINTIRRFRPEFKAWADTWEKAIEFLTKEKEAENAERKDYYFIIKKPSTPSENRIKEME